MQRQAAAFPWVSGHRFAPTSKQTNLLPGRRIAWICTNQQNADLFRPSLAITYKDSDGIEKSFPIEKLAGPVTVQNNGYEKLNIYCMYAVKVPEFEESYETEEERVAIVENINQMLKERITLSDEILSLGEFAVIVYQVEDFIGRIKKAAQEKGFVFWNGLIDYYDPDTFNGSFKELEAIFRKRSIYEHQNEYRFAFGSHEPDGTKLIHLGSLNGIAIKAPTREINEKLQLKLFE